MFKVDIYNTTRSIGFKMVFGIYMLFSMAGFIICVNGDMDTHYQFIRSADENFILMGTETTFLLKVFTVLFPITSCMISSQSLFKDISSNRTVTQIQRCGNQDYIRAKVCTTVILTFLCTTVPLLINLILCHLVYPVVGYDTEWGETSYNIGAWSYESSRFIDLLRLEHPTLFNMIHIMIFGVFAVLISVLALGILLHVKERLMVGYLLPIIILLVCTILDAFLMSFSMGGCFMYNYLLPNSDGNVLEFILLVSVWGVIDWLIICHGRKCFGN